MSRRPLTHTVPHPLLSASHAHSRAPECRLVQDPDIEDGKRGCFTSHRLAARRALDAGAQLALTFEDDVIFLPHCTPHAASRAAAFLRAAPAGGAGDGAHATATGEAAWSVFFLGHFPRRMELTAVPDVVRVRSMDAHAYVLSRAGMASLAALEYAGDQVDVHFHYQCRDAYALYPMVAVQAAGHSDTEAIERAADWNDDKLRREHELYQGCVKRKALAAALGAGFGSA